MAHYSNCLIWALRKEATCGGFIKSRKSEHGWWRHWIWSPDGKEWWGFSPVKPLDWLPVPPPIFRGKVEKEE
jgi:hypothetical protein